MKCLMLINFIVLLWKKLKLVKKTCFSALLLNLTVAFMCVTLCLIFLFYCVDIIGIACSRHIAGQWHFCNAAGLSWLRDANKFFSLKIVEHF
jgi:hypothetical protein